MSHIAETFDEQPTRWSEHALEKAKIIQPLLEHDPIPGALMAEACHKASLLAGQEAGEDSSPQTIHNWIERFRRYGMDGLERKRRKTRNVSLLHPLVTQYVEDLILDKRRFKLAEVQRRAEKYARENLHLSDPKDLPSYDQVRYIDRRMQPAIKKLGRDGKSAYRNLHDFVVRFEASYANECWQGDHHLLDIIVVDPKTRQKLGRPWLTLIIDDYSRAIMGIHLSLNHPSSMSIALALRHAMLPKKLDWWVMQGIPDQFYIDNGKDYKSHHIEEVALHFGFMINAHEPYLPRAKGKVERFFRTLEEMCIAYLDGYVGSSPEKRPSKVKPSLTLAELHTKIVEFIRSYHERVHGTTGTKPRVRWLGTARFRAMRLVDATEGHNLDYLLIRDERKVRRDGIHFETMIYMDEENRLALYNYIGQKVEIFYDPNNLRYIKVRGKGRDGSLFVGTAVPQELLRPKRIKTRNQNKKKQGELNQQVKESEGRVASAGNNSEISTAKRNSQQPRSNNKSQRSTNLPRRFRHQLDANNE